MKNKATAFTKKHIIHLLFFVALFFCLIALLRPQSRALEEQQGAAEGTEIATTDTEGTQTGETSDNKQTDGTQTGETSDKQQTDGTQTGETSDNKQTDGIQTGETSDKQQADGMQSGGVLSASDTESAENAKAESSGDVAGSSGDTGLATDPAVSSPEMSLPFDSSETNGGGYLSEEVQMLAGEVVAAAQSMDLVVVQSSAILGDEGTAFVPTSISTGGSTGYLNSNTTIIPNLSNEIKEKLASGYGTASDGYIDPVWYNDGTSGKNYTALLYVGYNEGSNGLVEDETELRAAIDATYYASNTMFIIPVGGNISLTTAAVSLQNKNIVLRRAESVVWTAEQKNEQDDVRAALIMSEREEDRSEGKDVDHMYYYDVQNAAAYYLKMYYWDYDKDIYLDGAYANPKTISDPALYDGTPDYNITINTSNPHFDLGTGSNTSKLILENITLMGKNADGLDYSTAGVGSGNGGGIYHRDFSGGQTVDFTFAGNIRNVSGNGGGGAAICLVSNYGTLNLNFKMLGGVISHCARTEDGGGAISLQNCHAVGSSAVISGYSIIEDSYSKNEGGAIFASCNLILKDHVMIRNNKAQSGSGGIFMEKAVDTSNHMFQLTLQGNVKITGNEALSGKEKGTSQIWPGVGGGIYSRANVEMSDSVEISGNTAARAGGGIALGARVNANGQTTNSAADAYGDTGIAIGTNPTLIINGGQIINNTVTGANRELAGDTSQVIKDSVGAGGGIYAYDRTKILIPDVAGVTFLGNKSNSFVAHLDAADLRKDDTWKTTNSALGWTAFLGDRYDFPSASGPGGHIFGVIPTIDGTPQTSTGFEDEVVGGTTQYYNNLYNNYDIGVSNATTNGLFAQLERVASPAMGAGAVGDGTTERVGGIATTFSNGKSYEAFGGKTDWVELNQGNMTFTATPAEGYSFDHWQLTLGEGSVLTTVDKKVYLDIFGIAYTTSDNEGTINTKFATISEADGTLKNLADTVNGNAILKFKMPAAHVQLTAVYKQWAKLETSTVAFYAAKPGVTNYTLPDPKSIVITNISTNYPATNVIVSLGSVTRDVGGGEVLIPDETDPATPITADEYFTLGMISPTMINAGGNASISIQPNKADLPAGIYTATLKLSYNNGSTTLVADEESQVVITFVVYMAGSAELPLISMTPELNFGHKERGYVEGAVTEQTIELRNYGNAAAVITKVELINGDGTDAGLSGVYPSSDYKKKKENFELNDTAKGIDSSNSKEIPARPGGEGTFSKFPADGYGTSAWSVKPITGLLDGIYTAQVRITFNKMSAGGSVEVADAEFIVCYLTFEVKQPPIDVSVPVKLMFAAFEYQYTGDVAQPVKVKSPEYEIVSHGTGKVNVKVDFSKDGKWLDGTELDGIAADDSDRGNATNYQEIPTESGTNSVLKHVDLDTDSEDTLPATRSTRTTPILGYDNSIYLKFVPVTPTAPDVEGAWEGGNENALRLVPGYSGPAKQIGSIEQNQKLRFTIGGQYYGEFRPELKPKYNLIFTFELE
ncbi:hypothetical protein FACS1894111_06270 [Clostridia bacterium]|nr:hypothetical protein FACS1894111_06270 [Clostridia bacterium]